MSNFITNYCMISWWTVCATTERQLVLKMRQSCCRNKQSDEMLMNKLQHNSLSRFHNKLTLQSSSKTTKFSVKKKSLKEGEKCTGCRFEFGLKIRQKTAWMLYEFFNRTFSKCWTFNRFKKFRTLIHLRRQILWIFAVIIGICFKPCNLHC